MLNKENQSWQDITDLINKVLLVEGKEISQIKYIMEKTQYFYNLLMGDFKKKRKVDEQTILLEDTITNEEYLAYYNILKSHRNHVEN